MKNKVLGLTLILAMLLSACSGSDESSAPEESSGIEESAQSAFAESSDDSS